jgi:hypothetical protein
MGRKPIANDQLGHGPHVYFEHLGDALSGEDLPPWILVIRELFTHDRSNELANFVPGQLQQPQSWSQIVM